MIKCSLECQTIDLQLVKISEGFVWLVGCATRPTPFGDGSVEKLYGDPANGPHLKASTIGRR